MGKSTPFIWRLEDLPELKTGDNLAFQAVGIQKLMVALIGAVSFHWGMLGEKLADDVITVGDYSVFDSTGKGITAHLLSEYRTRHMRVYRPKMAPEALDHLKPLLLKRYYYYGDQTYDWKGVIMVGFWCLLRKLGFHVEWWEHNSSRFWCLEFNEIVLRDLDFPLVPVTEPPYPTNMENSSKLEKIWGTF